MANLLATGSMVQSEPVKCFIMIIKPMRELIQDEKSNDVLSIRTIISQKCQFAQGWGNNALILIQIAKILKRTLIVRW